MSERCVFAGPRLDESQVETVGKTDGDTARCQGQMCAGVRGLGAQVSFTEVGARQPGLK